MVWTVAGKGNFRIDRRFDGVGRVQLSSGTKDEKQLAAIHVMLDDLRASGRTEDLVALRDKHITPLEALHQWKRGKLEGSDSIKAGKELIDALNDYLAKSELADTTVVGYRNCMSQLLKVAGKTPSIADLPAILHKYRAHCSKNDTARSFNQARAFIRGFLRFTLGRRSAIYQRVVDVEDLVYRKERINNPLTVLEVVALTDRLPKDIGEMVWTMCVTGMGPKEYLSDGFELKSNHIVVKGEKNVNRNNRIVPLVYQPALPTVQYKALRQYIKKIDPKRVPYDFRRTFAVWCESAGILQSHIDAYMGHAASSMSKLYKAQDMIRHLDEDAAALRSWIERERRRKPKVKKVTIPAIPASRTAQPKKKKVFQHER